jgi:hypothetical protein
MKFFASIFLLFTFMSEAQQVKIDEPNKKEDVAIESIDMVLHNILVAQDNHNWKGMLDLCSVRVNKAAQYRNSEEFEASFYIKEAIKYSPKNSKIIRLRTHVISSAKSPIIRIATIFKASNNDNKEAVLYAELVVENDKYVLDKIFPSPISRLFLSEVK